MVSVALEAVAGTTARLLFISIAAVCIIIAGPVTHGLGGKLRHAKTGEWRFFQPWRGGVAFVAAQALGWALYSVSIVAFIAAFWCAAIAAAMLCLKAASSGCTDPPRASRAGLSAAR